MNIDDKKFEGKELSTPDWEDILFRYLGKRD
jgi:hypothetical protein